MAKSYKNKQKFLPLEHRIAELLSKEEFRPFDSRLKEILRKPGVLVRLLATAKDLPSLELGLTVAGSAENHDFEPLGEEYRTTQITFRADIVGQIGPNHIVHVEQQTKHSRKPALRRMMQYGALIASYYDFQKCVTQLYYHTGDTPARWHEKDFEGGLIFNGNGSMRNSFIFIDAARHDAWSMLRDPNFFYAMLGLLAENIRDEAHYCSKLVQEARKRFADEELREVLVTCIVVGQLRNRGRLIWPHVLDSEADHMFDEEFFAGWEEIIRTRNADHFANIARAVELIKETVLFDLPEDFLERAMKYMSRSQVAAVRNTKYETLSEICEEAGIPVVYFDDGRAPEYFPHPKQAPVREQRVAKI
ncbi:MULTISPECIES: hypothetical protein [unclassified Rhizobium]|uniref:hypothetical protein n=1 Tax=unclassified Rhizobium TaxID=2613769 RepID=UPI000F7357BE|nr:MULTISPECIES: hypothetical protein [unclassified Rhizobium]